MKTARVQNVDLGLGFAELCLKRLDIQQRVSSTIPCTVMSPLKELTKEDASGVLRHHCLITNVSFQIPTSCLAPSLVVSPAPVSLSLY